MLLIIKRNQCVILYDEIILSVRMLETIRSNGVVLSHGFIRTTIASLLVIAMIERLLNWRVVTKRLSRSCRHLSRNIAILRCHRCNRRSNRIITIIWFLQWFVKMRQTSLLLGHDNTLILHLILAINILELLPATISNWGTFVWWVLELILWQG